MPTRQQIILRERHKLIDEQKRIAGELERLREAMKVEVDVDSEEGDPDLIEREKNVALVSQLEVKVKTSGRMGGQSNLSERRSKKSGDKTTRNITIQSYEFNMDGEAAGGPLTLLVRLPQNVKRERVKFKLTGLDLL